MNAMPLLKFIMILGLYFPILSHAFTGGSGTSDEPYQIATCQQLQDVNKNVSAHYKVVENINCQGFDSGDGKGFMPIGDNGINRFKGTFDGGGFALSGLQMERSKRVGLFAGMGDGGKIENLVIIEPDIKMLNGGFRTDAAVLVANVSGGNIKNVKISGGQLSAADAYDVGGLVGLVELWNDIRFENNQISGNFKVTGNSVGGLIGHVSISRDLKPFYLGNSSVGASVTVKGTGSTTGGLIGTVRCKQGGFVTACQFVKNYSMATVTGGQNVGGLMGVARGGPDSVIEDSYALGAATGGIFNTGGLIGELDTITLRRSFSAGEVDGQRNVGGLIGSRSRAAVIDSYWDQETSKQSTSAGGTGKQTRHMYLKETYSNWDFNTVWQIEQGKAYPKLRQG